MSLKIKTIIAICISIVLVGLAVLVWAYQTGRVTIFGSEQTSNVTYEVKGAELSKGTADANIDLSQNKIMLKRNGASEVGNARLDINKLKYGTIQLAPPVHVSENFIGLYMISDTAGSNLNNRITHYLENLNSGSFDMRWISTDSAIYQTSHPWVSINIGQVNPEIKFYTETGQYAGEMFLEVNGHKEKYLGVSLVRNETTNNFNSPEELYVVAAGYNPADPSKINTYSYKLGTAEKSMNSTEWIAWYNEKIAAWLPNKEFKIVVAKSIDGENIGTPHLLWQSKDTGEYLGYTRVERPVEKTGWQDDSTIVEEGFLTSTGLTRSGKVCAYNFYQGSTENANCQSLSKLLENNPKVFVQTNELASQGVYTYSTGNSQVTKYNTFEPINQVLPENSKITYRFAGSADNSTWSSLNPADGVQLTSTTNLADYIPSDSKYFKVEITAHRGIDTPSLEGFKINYDINGTVPPNTDPSNAGQVTTSETGSSNIATLVSTGSLLWVNILIALIFGGLITWLLVRKPSK